jgi:hypothetical protein
VAFKLLLESKLDEVNGQQAQQRRQHAADVESVKNSFRTTLQKRSLNQ